MSNSNTPSVKFSNIPEKSLKSENGNSQIGNISYVHCENGNYDHFITHSVECTRCTNKEWTKFTKTTSLHGLRYIWDDETFTVRRIIWLILVLGGICLMSYQILDRLLYYMGSPVTVNLVVSFNKSLQFPSVTFCNQNAFRSSSAALSQRYELITKMFNNFNNFSLDDLDKYNVSDVSLDDLYLSSGHRIEDMIIRCKWKGYRCGPNNFTRILSDKGVCYTFNSETENQLLVNSVGSDNGLSLTLNIEDYEYMPGPNDASGIKLLVHDKQHFPKVHELGIALSSGLESFVGLEFISVSNLPKPVGGCENLPLKYFTNYSPDNCQMECLTGLITQHCNCRLHYMPYNNYSPPVCTFYQYYHCYLPNKENFINETNELCVCPVACDFKIFDPMLSYSSLSQMVKSRLLEGANISSIKQKYNKAREITNRLQKDHVEAFKVLLDSVKSKFTSVKKVLLESLTKDLKFHQNATLKSYKEISDVKKTTSKLYTFRKYMVSKNFVRAGDAMGERTFDSVTMDMQQFVVKTESLLKAIASSDNISQETRQALYIVLSTDLTSKIDMCDRAFSNFTQLYGAYKNGTHIFSYAYSGKSKQDRIEIIPRGLLQRALNYTTKIKNRVAKYFTGDLLDIKQRLKNMHYLVQEAFYNQTFNETEYLHESVQYLYYCRQFLQSKSHLITEATKWPVTQMTKQEKELNLTFKDITKHKNNILNIVSNLLENLQNVEQLFLNKLTEGIEMCEAYLQNGSVSKLNISEFFLSDDIKNGYNSLNVLFDEVRIRGNNIFDSWTNYLIHSQKLWKLILDDTDMKSYYDYKNMTKYLVTYEEIKSNFTRKLTYYRDMFDLRKIVQHVDDDFIRELKNLIHYMEEFNDSRKIDHKFVRKNFLVVNLYYKELNYEQITQQRAYDIFALLCKYDVTGTGQILVNPVNNQLKAGDIGGSMGLFIGASVMTIFELLDLFTNSLAKRASGQRPKSEYEPK